MENQGLWIARCRLRAGFVLVCSTWDGYCTRFHRFLEYMSSRTNSPGGGRTTRNFAMSIWFGVRGSSDKRSFSASTVSGRVFIIPSSFAHKCTKRFVVQLTSVLLKQNVKNIAGGANHAFEHNNIVTGIRWVEHKNCISQSCFKRNSLTALLFTSSTHSSCSRLAPMKFVPLSDRNILTCPRTLMNRRSAWMNESVLRERGQRSLWLSM